MTRAVFLSTGGDPFISLLVIKLWQERWYDEVNRFYIDYNNHSQVPLEVVSEFIDKVIKDSKVHLIYHPEGIGNGMPITEMVKICQEDLVLLLEDDGFIFASGEVDWQFQKIEHEKYDALGSSRFSCGAEIAEALKKKYNLDFSGEGDRGPNYWPNFFFCKREDLLKTDLNFASKEFKSDTYYDELDHTMSKTEYGDTFVWTCIQLRHLGVRFGEVPQYHASPEEIEEREQRRLKWQEGVDIPWIHGGSLSAGWNGYLSGNIPDVSDRLAKLEMETRVAFWAIASDVIEGFADFKRVYKGGIETLINSAKLDRTRIARKIDIYKQLMQV